MITLQSCRDFWRGIMGQCLGCCPRDSDNESIGPDGDRSRLINGEVLPNDSTHFRDSEEENDDFPYGSLGDNSRHIGKFLKTKKPFIFTLSIWNSYRRWNSM